MTTQKLGKTLKKRRESLNITVYRMMKESKLGLVTVKRIEEGNDAYTFKSLLAYCKVLGLEIEFVEINYNKNK